MDRDVDVGIDRAETLLRNLEFRCAYVRIGIEDLSVEVGYFHVVSVDERDPAYPRRCQI